MAHFILLPRGLLMKPQVMGTQTGTGTHLLTMAAAKLGDWSAGKRKTVTCFGRTMICSYSWPKHFFF